MATLSQKRARADEVFDKIFDRLRDYFVREGFTTLPAQRVNLPVFEEVTIFLRVTGTPTSASLDIAVEHNGAIYLRQDQFLSGTRIRGQWAPAAHLELEHLTMGPPYSVRVAEGTYVSF